MMAATENTSETYLRNDNNGPPSLNITIPKASDLKITLKRWEDVQLPIDILLLAVKDPEFLSCYYFMSDVFRSYTKTLGYVYFGNMGKDSDQKLKVALMTCLEGGGELGGAAIVLTKAVEILQPKALLCVGSCSGLHRDKTKLGDVVVSAKLTTYAQRRVTSNGVEFNGFTTPVSRDMSRLVRQAGYGWKVPLENPEVGEVKVHCDGEFLSGPEQVESSWRCDELVQLYPNAIAVELDGDGVFVAAHDLKTEWVVIKGISCYADCSASLTEDWVPYACTMAASVMNNILSEPIIFEQWPHYHSTINCQRANTQNGGNCQSVQPQGEIRSKIPLNQARQSGSLNEGQFSSQQGNCQSVEPQGERSKIPLNQARQSGSLSEGQFSTQHQVHSRSLPLNDGNTSNVFERLFQTFARECASGQLHNKGGPYIHYSARCRIYSWQKLWVYDATAWDRHSGIRAEAHHYESSEEAIQHAVKKLKDKLRDQGILS